MHDHLIVINQASLPQWTAAIATSIAVILAIWGEKIKHSIIKPKLVFLEVKNSPQNIGEQEVVMFRLRLENKGGISAKDVKAFVIENSNVDQKRFIPIPLNWTHINGRKRYISNGEEAYLDLFQKNNGRYLWYWPKGKAPVEPALTQLSTEGISELRIKFNDDYSILGCVKIEFDPKKDEAKIIL